MRPSWIPQIGPDPSDKCPYKRHRRSHRHRGEGHAKMEAETGVSNISQSEDSNPNLLEARNTDSLLELLEGAQSS